MIVVATDLPCKECDAPRESKKFKPNSLGLEQETTLPDIQTTHPPNPLSILSRC